jgi:para-aminobenzoate synthetase / 4-amino-4-deoxychorismate lyase
MPHSAVLFDPGQQCWWSFNEPLRVVTTSDPAQVSAALREVEAAAAAGLHAVGVVAYEAAAGFDPACTVHATGDFPLLWFGLYPSPQRIELDPAPSEALPADWRAELDETAFAGTVAAIKAEIARGATYQVNFTFPLRAPFHGDSWAFFRALVHGQQAGQAAYLDLGRFVVCCASPELFFSRDGNLLCTRPMKGTARRGLSAAQDRAQARALQASVKDRAENLMILDMLRNDLARLGGRVEVPELFSLERYPTLWQMTSTATTRSRAPLAEVFRALFPCASITGAPKLQTMQLIAALEGGPRLAYTGAIGHLAPDGRARFGVAIRTALIDRAAASVEYRVGAGITWDSESGAEYLECLAKAAILHRPARSFALLESLRWSPGGGYWLLAEHLQRLGDSADYFDFPLHRERLLAALAARAAEFTPRPHKVRLLLHPDGRIETTAEELPANPAAPLRLGLAAAPIDGDDSLLYHKTTWRRLYETARRDAPECDEVLLWNERGEVTEACTANLVAEIDGTLVTPPVACGLLPGTLRQRLLADGTIHEQVVTLAELQGARRLWLINAVRGWRRACFQASASFPEAAHGD